MNNQMKSKVPVPKGARLKPYYDTQPIVQNQAKVNFFSPSPSRAVTRNNYVSNPFPGEATRRIAGLSFDILHQFIHREANINPIAIVNGLKNAGVVLTADQSHTQFLRTTLDEQSNFAETEFVAASAAAWEGGAAVTETRQTAVLKSSEMYRLADPFDLANNQNLNLYVQFANASNFPTEAQWEASSQSQLFLRATLYLAELDG